MAETWDDQLARLEASGLRRGLRTVRGGQGRTLDLDGRSVLNFSSNNYLGLAGHPVLAAAAREACLGSGVGAGASRLISGNHAEHEALEVALASFHERPRALLFNSGYHANIGVLSALAGTGGTILSDELNHASIIDGCRLAKARVEVVPHADPGAVEDRLATVAGLALVVTDAVFSMDGDLAPLAELSAVTRRHGALLVVDEAHASGVLGPGGQGAAAAAGVEADVHIGTLSKGFGSFGGYVAGDGALVELLLNRARSFVYTTALPPMVVAATRAAVELVAGPEGETRRARLRDRVARFSAGLDALGLRAPTAGATPIFPVLVGDAGAAMTVCERLLERGIYAQGIRPPTVPRGTSRLRFALMADHTPEDIDLALEVLADLQREGLIEPRSAA